MSNEQSDGDVWKRWLLHRRDVTDEQRALAGEHFKAIRDKVLDKGGVTEGSVVLDVGTGTGLIAFGAIERVGPGGRVIFSDISADCLDHCRSLADDLGMIDRATFIEARIEDLAGIPDASVDVVTTRSVLIYTTEKQRAFAELYRVLKPEGRLSMFEPINRFGFAQRRKGFRGYDVEPVADLAERVRAAIEEHQPVKGSPMLDFDERDLLEMAFDAGFKHVELELNAAMARGVRGGQWESFYRSAPNPLALSLEEAVERALNEEERERFVAHLRDAVEHQEMVVRQATAFLVAVK
jgi:arsenite methyltransferase